MKENGPYTHTGTGTLVRYGVTGVGVVLLKELCYWGWAFRFQKQKPGPEAVSFCCLPVWM